MNDSEQWCQLQQQQRRGEQAQPTSAALHRLHAALRACVETV